MSKYFTQWDDFSVDVIGTNAAAWTNRAAASSRAPAYGALAAVSVKRRYLALTNTAAGFVAVSQDSLDADANRANFDIVTAFDVDTMTAETGYLIARGQGSFDNAVMLSLVKAGTLRIEQCMGSPNANTVLATIEQTFTAGKRYFARFNGSGSTLRGKVWDAALGAAGQPGNTFVLSLPGSIGNYASASDSAADSVTGDIDVSGRYMAQDWTPTAGDGLVYKSQSFSLCNQSDGKFKAHFSLDGSTVVSATSSAANSLADGGAYYWRVTRARTTGTVKFYTGTDGVTWTQLGTDQTTAPGQIYDSANTFDVGRAGRFGTAQWGSLNGITLAADDPAANGGYVGCTLRLTDGSNRSGVISAYNSTTKVATISSSWGARGTLFDAPWDYYVDSVAGNDSNAGTSSAAPWLTIAKILATSIPAGARIGFKCGSIFRELLIPTWYGTAAAPIVFGAYGSGNLPRFLGSDNISGAWTLVTGTEYKIATAKLLAAPAPSYYIDNSTGAVTRLLRGTAGSLAANQCAVTAGFLHVNVGFDPSSVGSVELPQRVAGIYLDATPYFLCQDLVCRYSNNDGMSIRNLANNITCRGMVFEYNCNDGCNVFTKCLNLKMEDCQFNYNGNFSPNYDGDGFSAHVDCTGTIRRCQMRFNSKNGISNSEQGTWDYIGCITQGNSGGDAAAYGEAGVAGTHNFRRCISYDGGDVRTGVGIYRYLTEPQSGSTINFYNCTVVKGTSVVNVPRGFRCGGSNGTVNLYNTVFSGTFNIAVLKAAGATVFNHDYLCCNGATTLYSGTVAGAHSISTAPTFVDAANADFTPAPGSVLIDAGVAIAGVTTDFTGAAPDIGALGDNMSLYAPDSAATYEIVGGQPGYGSVYSAKLYSGIAGTLVADFNPAVYGSVGAVSFGSSTGEQWTINQSGSPYAAIVAVEQWNIQVTNAGITAAGWLGLGASHSTNAGTVFPANFFSVGTGSDLAEIPITNDEFLNWLDGQPARTTDKMLRCVLAEFSCTGYNASPVGSPSDYTADRNVYISNMGYTSKSWDSPATRHYDDFIEAIPTFSREMGVALSGQASVGFGDLIVRNYRTDLGKGALDDWLRIHWNRNYLIVYLGDPSWDKASFRIIIYGRIGNPTAPTQGQLKFPIADLSDFLNKKLVTSRILTGDYVNQFKPKIYGQPRAVELLGDRASLTYYLSDSTLSADMETDGFPHLYDVTPTAFVHIGSVYGGFAVSAVDTVTGTITAGNIGSPTGVGSHGMVANYRVRWQSDPPMGMAINTNYWVISAGLSPTQFRLSATQGGAAITGGSGYTGGLFDAFGYTFDTAAATVTLAANPAGRIICMQPADLRADSNLITVTDILDDMIFNSLGLSQNYRDAASFTAARTVDITDSAYSGYALKMNESATAQEVLPRIANGMRAWFGITPDGLVQTGSLGLPSATAVMSFIESDVSADSLKMIDFIRCVDFDNSILTSAPWFVSGGAVNTPNINISGVYLINSQEALQGCVAINATPIYSSPPLDGDPANSDANNNFAFAGMGNATMAEAITRLFEFHNLPLGIFEFQTSLRAALLSIGDTISLTHSRLGWKQWTASDPASSDNLVTIDSRLAVVIGHSVNLEESDPLKQVTIKCFRQIPGYYPTADLN